MRKPCFISLPSAPQFKRYFQLLYAPAVTDAGFEVVWSDMIPGQDIGVPDMLWDAVKKARVCLADITDRDPNVMYELGLCHALEKPTVVLAQNITDIPRDLRAFRPLLYDRQEKGWGDKVKAGIKDLLTKAKASPAEFTLFKDTESLLTTTKGEARVTEVLKPITAQDEFVMTVAPEAAFQCMNRILYGAAKHCKDLSRDVALTKLDMIVDVVMREYSSKNFGTADPSASNGEAMASEIMSIVRKRIDSMLVHFRVIFLENPHKNLMPLLKQAIKETSPERIYDDIR